jgi:hypothetical protein
MAEIPENVIIFWPLNTGIPTGWTRVSSYNGYFLTGMSGNAAGGATGGSANHNHGAPSHTHPATGNHNHTWTANATANNPAWWGLGHRSVHVNGQDQYGASQHTHSLVSGHSIPAESVGNTNAGTASWSSGGNNPSYYDIIPIKSNESEDGFPDDSIVFYNSSSDPTDWTHHTGSQDRYFRATSGSSGGTGNSQSHSHSGGSHSHPGASTSHAHPGAYTGGASVTANWQGTSSDGSYSSLVTIDPSSSVGHKHHMTMGNAASSGTSSVSGSGSGGQSAVPPYYRLNAIQNDSGGGVWLENAICLWEGSQGSIPDDWRLCNGTNSTPDLRDKFIYNAGSSGSGTTGTGGATSHNHSGGGSHSHNTNSHSHGSGVASTTSYEVGNRENRAQVSQYINFAPSANHPHSQYSPAHNTNSDSGGSVPGVGTSIGGSSDDRPSFRTAVFIMAPEEPSAGGNIGMFGSEF